MWKDRWLVEMRGNVKGGERGYRARRLMHRSGRHTDRDRQTAKARKSWRDVAQLLTTTATGRNDDDHQTFDYYLADFIYGYRCITIDIQISVNKTIS